MSNESEFINLGHLEAEYLTKQGEYLTARLLVNIIYDLYVERKASEEHLRREIIDLEMKFADMCLTVEKIESFTDEIYAPFNKIKNFHDDQKF